MAEGAEQALTAQLAGVLHSEWTPEEFTSYYDQGWCLNQNVSYSHRVNAEDNFNYCSVPLSGADAFLFAGMALLVGSVCTGKLASVWVLIVGGCLGILNYEVNLYRLGNAISLWLGIQPPDLFFYTFLPPLLVDAALRLDWYRFSKLWPHIILLAYGMVLINALVLAPFILFVLGFSNRGWDWIHGAVLAAMLAPTDAVAVTAILKAGGGHEGMVVLMEGEALLNDASAVTLYTVFLHILMASSPDNMPSVPSQIWPIIRDILKLTGIGLGVGLAFAWALGYLLKLLRWRGVRPYIESLVVLATAYLAFYVAQGPAKGSGVIAVCLFGLYGSASGHWGMLATDAESGIHEAVWDTVAFAANALVFFWSGISSVNFVVRSASQLNKSAWNYGAIPIIFLFMYAFRGACMVAFKPIFKLMGTSVSLPECAFATVAGLRGSLTLIMAADFIIHSDFYSGGPVAEANFDVVLWASAFVLLSLLINAPLIAPVMRWTGLSRISPEKVRGRRRALEELRTFTAQSIAELKQQQDGEFLQGANWDLVATFVDQTSRLKGFVPKHRGSKRVAEGEQAAAAAAVAGIGTEASPAAAAAAAAGDQAAEGSMGPRKRSGHKVSFRLEADADDYEVPFMHHSRGGAPGPRPRPQVELAHTLNLPALQAAARGGGGSLRGSFYDAPPATTAEVAAAAAAAAVGLALGAVPAVPAGPRGPPTEGGSTVLVDGEEDEVELLFSRGEGGEEAPIEFDTRWQHSLDRRSAALNSASPGAAAHPAAAAAGSGGDGTNAAAEGVQVQLAAPASQEAAAAMLRRQISSVAASRAAAGTGSSRDLLGRLQVTSVGTGALANAAAAPDASPHPPAPRDAPAPPAVRPSGVSAALLSRAPSRMISRHLEHGGRVTSPQANGGPLGAAPAEPAGRDLEAGQGPAGARQGDEESLKAGSASEDGGDGEALLDLRLRVLTGVKRHFRAKRMAGLLSPHGLRVAIYACDRATEHAEEHPSEPLKLWHFLNQEIRGNWVTFSLASLLAGTLRVHRASPRWWQLASALPFRLFTGLLRKKLGSKMLIACEATVELYMGLAASPQMQWVYFGDEVPVELLEEVQGQLLGAYNFIQDREAEAPAQYRAVQSYRAAMAVLRQQRTFTVDLYERGAVDADEREALAAAVDAAMRHLDMTGPIWRPPVPEQVLRSLDIFKAAPPELTDSLLRGSTMIELRPQERVWTSEEPHLLGGLFVVLSGVVQEEYAGPDGCTIASQLQGVGSIFGDFAGLCGGGRLPGSECVTAVGNSFGRGPLLCHLPPAALDTLHTRAASGCPAAAALESELLRIAAMHMLQHMQGDVQSVVSAYLERHRPLGKYSAAEGQRRQLPERVARYTAQVLLDLLQAIPTAPVVQLAAGEVYRQGSHVVLLQGSLVGELGAGEVQQAPAVLPYITSHRFSFAQAGAAQEQQPAWQAGTGGAKLLVAGNS